MNISELALHFALGMPMPTVEYRYALLIRFQFP
jgi:hypothetical protein